jgi:class 3 adenylate cyclase
VVVFPSLSASKEDLSKAVDQATICSLQMLNALDPFPVDKELSLRLHIGLGAGSLYGIHVGGVDNRWEYFAAGDALSQLKYAVDASKQGEVGLSPEAWALVNQAKYGNFSVVEEHQVYVLSGSNYPSYRCKKNCGKQLDIRSVVAKKRKR